MNDRYLGLTVNQIEIRIRAAIEPILGGSVRVREVAPGKSMDAASLYAKREGS